MGRSISNLTSLLGLAAVCFMFATTPSAALPDPLISLEVNPIFQYAPGTVTIRVKIEPHYENTMFCLSYESEDSNKPYSNSCRELNGQYGPKTTQMVFKGLVTGEYLVTLQLYRTPSRMVAEVTKEFTVLDNR